MASVRHNNSGNTHIEWYLIICHCFSETEVAILNFKMTLGDSFWPLSVILVKETLILGGIWSFSAVFQTPEVAIFNYKTEFGDNFWPLSVILAKGTPILGGIWSYLDIFQNRKSPSWILKWHLKTISSL